MDWIREWAVLLCISSVTSGVIVFLIPDGKLRKTANIVISLFMLSTFVSVFSDVKLPNGINSTTAKNELYDYSENIDDILIKESQSTAEKIIGDSLNDICNFTYTIETDWKVNNNEVSLSEIIIKISHADYSKLSLIKTKVGSLTGVIPKVIAE